MAQFTKYYYYLYVALIYIYILTSENSGVALLSMRSG